MSDGNTTLSDITSADWELMLDQNSPSGLPGSGIGNVVQGVADINQCIGIILSTPQGSDPLRPTFACNLWQWLDAPINIARPHLVREIVEALTKWEPRVRVLSVVVNLVPNDLTANVNAHLDITIVWQLKVNVSGPGGPQTSQQLTITVPRNLA
jgi:phage baseplate assembly protein W